MEAIGLEVYFFRDPPPDVFLRVLISVAADDELRQMSKGKAVNHRP
jgi:hypothetical protein